MPMGPGKKFEQDFQKSVPTGFYYYRLRDAAGWRVGTDTRFTVSNDYDMFMFALGYLFAIELKTVKGKSISFKSLNPNQEMGLMHAAAHEGVQAGVLVFLRASDEIFWVPIWEWVSAKARLSRKSLGQAELRDIGIAVSFRRPRTRIKVNVYNMVVDAILNQPKERDNESE
jgi:penicillin-binding protein-related factor A (putative recombinase)